MKKLLSLGLVAAMAVSAMPMAYATTAHTNGTQVEYIADADANREYTITVPAKMTPKLGQAVTGTVTLSGKWASNETVTVTADAEVELTNSINENDKHKLAITFPKMEYAGNNTVEKTYTETVTLAEMPADALFGEWTGKFNYKVDFSDEMIEMQIPYKPGAQFDIDYVSITFKEGMTWREWVEEGSNPTALIPDFAPYPGTVSVALRYVIDSNNKFVSPDAVIDPNAHYELFHKSGDNLCSPSFGATEPTFP